jgi:hypothetical protein
VVGVEISQANVEVARDAAKAQSLPVEFVQADLRDGRWHREFDVVLSLNDGAIGYFPTEAENRRVFEVISGALKGPGRHVAQIPNVMHVEKSPSGKSRIEGAEAVELVDHHWNSQTRCQEGTITYLGEGFEKSQPIPFRKRLYSVEELRDIYESVGMRLTNLFRGNGKPGRPRNTQYELFLQACKATAP